MLFLLNSIFQHFKSSSEGSTAEFRIKNLKSLPKADHAKVAISLQALKNNLKSAVKEGHASISISLRWEQLGYSLFELMPLALAAMAGRLTPIPELRKKSN